MSQSFSCRQCGACCRWPGFIHLTANDITRLARHVNLSEQAFIDRFTLLAPNRRGLRLAVAENAPCLFLEGNACSVYAARPDQCRDFPHGWTVSSGCPAQSHEPALDIVSPPAMLITSHSAGD